MSNIILTPRVTEKAIGMAEKGVYVFDVSMRANKVEIAKAVEKQFKVNVEDVNIAITKGKVKRFRKFIGQENDFKKAMVKLKKGQSIALFEGSK